MIGTVDAHPLEEIQTGLCIMHTPLKIHDECDVKSPQPSFSHGRGQP